MLYRVVFGRHLDLSLVWGPIGNFTCLQSPSPPSPPPFSFSSPPADHPLLSLHRPHLPITRSLSPLFAADRPTTKPCPNSAFAALLLLPIASSSSSDCRPAPASDLPFPHHPSLRSPSPLPPPTTLSRPPPIATAPSPQPDAAAQLRRPPITSAVSFPSSGPQPPSATPRPCLLLAAAPPPPSPPPPTAQAATTLVPFLLHPPAAFERHQRLLPSITTTSPQRPPFLRHLRPPPAVQPPHRLFFSSISAPDLSSDLPCRSASALLSAAYS